MCFKYGAITHSGAPFQVTSSTQQLGNSVHDLTLTLSVPLPRISNAIRLTLIRFGLYPFRSPLLRVSRLLSFPRGTEMFQFPRFPPTALCVQAAVHTP